MTFDKILEHLLWMSAMEPDYALKAAKWYGQVLDMPDLARRLDAEMKRRQEKERSAGL